MKRGALLFAMVLAATAPARAQITLASIGASATGNGTSAAVVLPARGGQHYVVEDVAASCALTPATPVLLTVTDGGNVIFQQYLSTDRSFHFDDLHGTINNTLNVTFGVCGPNVVGTVSLVYKTY